MAPNDQEKDENVVLEPKTEQPDSSIKPEISKEEKPEHPHKKKEKKKPTLEDQIDAIEMELKEIKDKYLRTLAEMENLKKRTQEETKRERKYASMMIADKLIDQIEVFDQALQVKTEDKNFQNFLTGFRMIKDMMYQSLESEGVKLIDTTIGKVFDPNTEHAFDHRYEPDKPENTILEVIKKGYMFKDRLLRPALVVVNIKPEEETSQDKEEKETEKQTIDENVA